MSDPIQQEGSSPFTRTGDSDAPPNRTDLASLTLTVALVSLRVSTEDQARTGLGMRAQRISCEQYLAAHGWMLHALFACR